MQRLEGSMAGKMQENEFKKLEKCNGGNIISLRIVSC